MLRQSQQPFLNRINIVDKMLAALDAVPGAAFLTTPKLHLFSAITGTITANFLVSQFTECTFNGYVAVTLPALSANVNTPGAVGRARFTSGSFIGGSTLSPPGETAIGYWIDDGGSPAKPYLAELFTDAVPFANPGDFLDLVCYFSAAFAPVTS